MNENNMLNSVILTNNIRYNLSSNMLNEMFIQFVNQNNTLNLIETLINNCKQNPINFVR